MYIGDFKMEKISPKIPIIANKAKQTLNSDGIPESYSGPHIKHMSVRLAESNMPCEDRYSLRSNLNSNGMQLFGVFDGHGGYLAADIAHAKLLDIIVKNIMKFDEKDKYIHESIAKAIDESFIECDKIILEEALRIHHFRRDGGGITGQLSQESQPYRDKNGHMINKPLKPTGRAGSCALVMLILNGTMYFAHSGDCRAVICSSSRSPQTTIANGSSPSDTKNNKSPQSSAKKRKIYSQDSPGVRGHKDTAAAASPSIETSPIGFPVDFTSKDYFLEEINSAKLNDTVLHSDKKRGREEGGKGFSCSIRGLRMQGITVDHSPNLSVEADAIKGTNLDKQPIRRSIGDRVKPPPNAPLRVAGSLAVTRALGDGYLKMKELSVEPFASYCPYITCRPSVNWRKIDSKDCAVIMASDGLWNFISAKDCTESIQARSANETKNGKASLSFMNDDRSFDVPEEFHFDSHVGNESTVNGDAGFEPVKGACNGEILSDTNISTIGDISNNAKSPSAVTSSLPQTPDSTVTETTVLTSESSKKRRQAQVISSTTPVEEAHPHSELNMDAAHTLLETCLRAAASNANTSAEALRNMQSGNRRREIIDDITVMVLYF